MIGNLAEVRASACPAASRPRRRPTARSSRPTGSTSRSRPSSGSCSDGERELADAGAAIRGLFDARRVPGGHGRRDPIGVRGAGQAPRDRPTSTSRCAAAPPPRTCPTPASPASRTPTSTSPGPTRCSRRARTATRRCSPTAPSATASSRASTTPTSRSRSACRRWCAPTSASAGVMFTIDTDTGFPDTAIINGAWGLGENVVGGEVTPDQWTVYKPFLDGRGADADPRADASGRRSRSCVYTDRGQRADRQRRHRRRGAPRARPRRRRGPRARPLGRDHRAALRAARWTSSGPRTGAPASCSSSRRAPRRCSRAQAPARSRRSASTRRARCSSPGSRSARRSPPGEVQVIASADDVDQFDDGTRAGHRDDRPGLGADHEARRRHRHRPRRPHLARRHRQPRARGARPSSAPRTPPSCSPTGREVTLSCAEGDEGHVYDGHPRVLRARAGPRGGARDDARA